MSDEGIGPAGLTAGPELVEPARPRRQSWSLPLTRLQKLAARANIRFKRETLQRPQAAVERLGPWSQARRAWPHVLGQR